MNKFQANPVVIEAIQFIGTNEDEVIDFIGESYLSSEDVSAFNESGESISMTFIKMKTLEGETEASIGDYIIKGTAGEFYPCKPEIFAEKYKPVL